jgi:NADH:ubiquinone oxidoreductase subunit 3 (subunit A)
MHEYLIIVFILFIALLLACSILFLSYFLNPQDSNFKKHSSYECGFQPFEDARQSFNIEFFLVGILFVIFDLEIVFLFPLCLCLDSLSMVGAFTTISFLVVLTSDLFMNG